MFSKACTQSGHVEQFQCSVGWNSVYLGLFVHEFGNSHEGKGFCIEMVNVGNVAKRHSFARKLKV